MRISWDDVMGKNVYEFFNIMAYSADKKNFEKQQINDYIKNN